VEQRERVRDAAGAARYPTPAPLAEIRVGLGRSDPGPVLLEFFWGERDVYGWSVGTQSLTAKRLGSADSLAAQVEFLRAALEAPTSGMDWRGAAARAHATFIAPLAVPPASHLLIVADGPLAHVPFEVLLEPTQQVTYGPSASVLRALATARDSAWDRTALVVGDPSGRRGELPDLTRGAAPLGPLPYAGAEAQAIYDLFAPRADLLLRRQATLARWQRLDPSRYRFLHFAAHARVSDREPELTHLVLADGGLDLAAIRRLRLSAQLVSLSACETALGLRVRGEGVIGLPHAFLAAGARAVVVTLWRVDDQAAADFMTDFYRELAAGRAAAEALRRARERRRGEHPSRWAAFVLVGAGG
jgi:CHAT domain-containing protein